MGVLALVMGLLFLTLAYRFYSLQIVQGQQYQDAFLDQIERTETAEGIRGSIYDRNGRLLAYNELSWQVSIEDNGVYSGQEERNRELNRVLAEVVSVLEENGDEVERYLPMEMAEDGTLTYTWDGSRRLRFLADVYGHASVEELAWRERDRYDEREATCEQALSYLCSESMYGTGEIAEPRLAWLVTSLRYAMARNRYQRYLDTVIADGISEESMAALAERQESLPGISVTQETKRRYRDSVYFALIDNNLLDTKRLDGMAGERLAERYERRLGQILAQWATDWETPYGQLGEEAQGYQDYALSVLEREEITAAESADRDVKRQNGIGPGPFGVQKSPPKVSKEFQKSPSKIA